MAEYIKREDALKIADEFYDHPIGKGIAKSIFCLPAADVVERKTGKWKTALLDHESFGVRPKVLYCSECHQAIAYPTHYCPNCGAMMEES